MLCLPCVGKQKSRVSKHGSAETTSQKLKEQHVAASVNGISTTPGGMCEV